MCRHKWPFGGIWMLLAGLLLGTASCQEEMVYSSFRPVPSGEGWYRRDTLVYTLPPDSALEHSLYRLEICLRNYGNYPYRDIWLEVSQNWRDSLVYEKDTLHIYLADEKGNLYGGNTGNLHQHVYACSRLMEVRQTESAVLRIVSIMKANPLPGISDVGIRLIRP